MKHIRAELENYKLDDKQLTLFGVLFVAFGAFIIHRLGLSISYIVPSSIALLLFFLLFPKSVIPFHTGMSVLSILVSYLLSRVLLIVLFYGMITPIGIVGKILGKSFLKRDINKSISTYWEPYEGSEDNSLKQF